MDPKGSVEGASGSAKITKVKYCTLIKLLLFKGKTIVPIDNLGVHGDFCFYFYGSIEQKRLRTTVLEGSQVHFELRKFRSFFPARYC